ILSGESPARARRPTTTPAARPGVPIAMRLSSARSPVDSAGMRAAMEAIRSRGLSLLASAAGSAPAASVILCLLHEFPETRFQHRFGAYDGAVTAHFGARRRRHGRPELVARQFRQPLVPRPAVGARPARDLGPEGVVEEDVVDLAVESG